MRYSLLAAALLAACGDDIILEGDVYQYAVGELRLPTGNTSAREMALDLNGDGVLDNQLGQVFGTLETMGYKVGETARESLLRGKAIMLAELQTTSFDATPLASITTHLGATPVPAACLDDTNLSTCGQHLATRAHYDLQDDGASTPGLAAFVDGTFEAALDTLPVELSIDDEAPLRVDLQSARVRLTQMSPDGGTALLSGGIPTADVHDVVIPAATRQLARIVTEDCTLSGDTCRCASDSRGAFMQELFDANSDCVLTVDEVRNNTVVQALLSPDLRLENEDLVSFSFSVDFVPAEF